VRPASGRRPPFALPQLRRPLGRKGEVREGRRRRDAHATVQAVGARTMPAGLTGFRARHLPYHLTARSNTSQSPAPSSLFRVPRGLPPSGECSFLGLGSEHSRACMTCAKAFCARCKNEHMVKEGNTEALAKKLGRFAFKAPPKVRSKDRIEKRGKERRPPWYFASQDMTKEGSDDLMAVKLIFSLLVVPCSSFTPPAGRFCGRRCRCRQGRGGGQPRVPPARLP